MGNRSRAFIVTQLGEEVTPGTAVPADQKLPNLMLRLAMAGEPNREWMAAGYLFPSDTSNGLEWTAGTYEGPPTFDESRFVFNSLIKTVAETGTTAKTRVWSPSVGTEDVFSTYTVERGMTGAVLTSPYLFMNTLRLQVSKRGGAVMNGNLMAQEPGAAAALTATPTVVPSTPIPGTAFNLNTATTFANLDASPTQILTGFNAELNYGPVHKDAAFINSISPSFDAVGTIVPASSFLLTLPLDVSGSDFVGALNLSKKRLGTPVYLQLIAEGVELETGVNETFKINMCLKARRLPDETDIDGVFWGLTWECGLYIDETSGKAMEITTISGS